MTKNIHIHNIEASPREHEFVESIKHHGIGSPSAKGHFNSVNPRQVSEYEL